ncbi:MAG: LysR substrate-binding domain-containing protein [Mesorhizobium sp.]
MKSRTALPPISLRQVEAFKAVIDTGSVTAAANLLHVSQPSLSRLIKTLEGSLDFSLFERRKGRLVPTPEALLLYEEVQKYFRSLQTLAQTAVDIRGLARGHLRIASFAALSIAVTPRAIKRFCQLNAYMRVSTTTGQSRQIVDLVAARFADLGIVDPVAVTDSVRIEKRWQFPCVCVVPNKHPLAECGRIGVDELRTEKMIGLGREFMSRYRQGAAFYETLAPQMHIQVQQSIAACALVAEYAGVAIVDPFTARQWQPMGIAVKPLNVDIPFEICVVASSEIPLSIAARQFLTLFEEELSHS